MQVGMRVYPEPGQYKSMLGYFNAEDLPTPLRREMPRAINLAEAVGLGDDLDEPDLKEMLTYEKQTPHLEGSGWGAFF